MSPLVDTSSRLWVIYTLSDPRRPKCVRYVGVTHDKPRQRLARHLSNARKRPNTHCAKWLLSLLNEGVQPALDIIDRGAGAAWEEAEVHWIVWHRERKHPLTNHAKGGRGPVGCARTPETRARLAAANRGKKQSPELIEKRIAPLRGRHLSPEARDKLREAAQGRKVSDEGRAAIATARRTNPEWNARIKQTNKETWARKKAMGEVSAKGRKRPLPKTERRCSDETRAKMSTARRGKVQTPETRAKHRANMQRIWAERKAAQALHTQGTP